MADYEVVDEKSYDAEIEFIGGKLKDIKSKASKYVDKLSSGEDITEKDIKELTEMKEQTSSIRDITKKIPLFGSLIEISCDLTEILSKALKLMIENMKSAKVNKAKSETIHINTQGIELSDNISKTMHNTAKTISNKERETITLSNSGSKLAARSNYFGYEEKPKEENKDKPQDALDEEAKMQARLDAYNKDVKARGEKSKEAEANEMSSSGAALQPSKED